MFVFSVSNIHSELRYIYIQVQHKAAPTGKFDLEISALFILIKTLSTVKVLMLAKCFETPVVWGC